MSIKDTENKSVSFELSYHNKEGFLIITQTKKPDNTSLPIGKEITVNGVSAVMVTGLIGKISAMSFGRKLNALFSN